MLWHLQLRDIHLKVPVMHTLLPCCSKCTCGDIRQTQSSFIFSKVQSGLYFCLGHALFCIAVYESGEGVIHRNVFAGMVCTLWPSPLLCPLFLQTVQYDLIYTIKHQKTFPRDFFLIFQPISHSSNVFLFS